MITITITIQQGNLELSGGCRSVSNRELGRIIIIDVQVRLVRLVSECECSMLSVAPEIK
jgi:hypothetical protein